ncbi:MAG: MerR family transcriptional regulator [Sulfuricellaceae bacterium]|nr:MerR family transcriptional regulator [Sulfuricellaceae bacterium]
MDADNLKKIGEVADLLGTTPRALRYYEEEGLVAACRTPGGTRLYSTEDIARFKAVLRLAHSGLPISLIKELASIRSECTTGEESSHKVHAVIHRLISQVKNQIVSLASLESELSFASATVEGCFHCTNPPTRKGCPQCPVNQNLQMSELLNLIWEQQGCQDQTNTQNGKSL